MSRLILTVMVVGTTGCFHAVINTGRQPSGETIERPWAHSFLAGLVPPSVTETAERCPGGVARVETKRSFLNLVAEFVTFGIYSPMWIKVSCAGTDDAGTPDGAEISAQRHAGAAFEIAVERAMHTGRPVHVDFR